jgi:hypothetical protein
MLTAKPGRYVKKPAALANPSLGCATWTGTAHPEKYAKLQPMFANKRVNDKE